MESMEAKDSKFNIWLTGQPRGADLQLPLARIEIPVRVRPSG